LGDEWDYMLFLGVSIPKFLVELLLSILQVTLRNFPPLWGLVVLEEPLAFLEAIGPFLLHGELVTDGGLDIIPRLITVTVVSNHGVAVGSVKGMLLCWDELAMSTIGIVPGDNLLGRTNILLEGRNSPKVHKHLDLLESLVVVTKNPTIPRHIPIPMSIDVVILARLGVQVADVASSAHDVSPWLVRGLYGYSWSVKRLQVS
jgi:hypothetical protein